MLKLYLRFNECQPIICLKRYAYKKKSTRERGETPKRRPIQIMKKVLKSDLSYVAYALTNHLCFL